MNRATCPSCTHNVNDHAGLAGCLMVTDGAYCACTMTAAAILAQGSQAPGVRDQAADLTKGRALAEQGTERVLAPQAMDAWRERAYAWIDSEASKGHAITSTELTDAIGMAPSPNAVGAVFRVKAKAGVIVGGGYVQSTRPSCHGAVVRVWTPA